jgi:gas vesicle protein
MFLLRLPFLPLKLAFFIGRLLGYNRIAYLTIGVLIGLFLAPTTGAEMREKVRARFEAGNASAGTTPSV